MRIFLGETVAENQMNHYRISYPTLIIISFIFLLGTVLYPENPLIISCCEWILRTVPTRNPIIIMKIYVGFVQMKS